MKNVKHTVLSFLGIVALSMMLISCYSLWDDLSSVLVTFNGNNGIGTMEPQIFVSKVPQALNENKFTREGYTFAGWATAADASTAEFADKANFTATKDITLYAIWNKIPPAPVPSKYTITYVSDKGTLPKAKTVEQGYKLTADDLQVLKETGYNFKGWDKVVGDEITSDTTITASWIKTWTITYASTYGTKLDNKTVEEGYKLVAEDLLDLTETGYNFKGWDKSVGDVISSDTTITASWKKTWKITYSLPSGYSKEAKVVEEGYKLTVEDLPNIETNDTYYMLNKNVGYEITADTQITGDWDGIVYLNTFSKITDIKNNKAKIEKIVFTSDTYSGAATTIDCADNSTNPAIPTDYFKGVLTDGTVSGQYILTVYGNGHRIYAPENCSSLFASYQKLTTIEFNNFYTSKTTNMTGMFAGSNALNSLNVSGFNTAKVTNMTGMFTGYKGTELNLSNFDTSKVENMKMMFQACTNLTTLNISSFNTSAVKDMSNMFYGCSSLTSLDVSKFVTANVTNMSALFSGCSSLKTIDLSNFNTEKVTNMSSMFKECKELTTLKISSLNTSEVSDMSYMFDTCEKLESLDLSHFNTSKVTTMVNMFNQCKSLKSINVSSFNTSKVTNMGHMFNRCEKLTSIEVSNFNTSAVSSMSCMFQECISLISLDLSSFVNSSLVDIDTMFSKCTELETIYVLSGFDLSNISTQAVDLLFSGDSKLVGSEGSACNGSTNIGHSYAHIDEGTSNPGYFTLKQ